MSNITIHANTTEGHKEFKVEFTTFSDGTETCYLGDQFLPLGNAFVTVDIEDGTRDLVRIALVKNALDTMIAERMAEADTISLALPYMPQARADRVFVMGMGLPIKVFANIINSLNFDSVLIDDPHSDVATALIDRVSPTNQADCVLHRLTSIKKVLGDFEIVAPDVGASKKVNDVAQRLKRTSFIQGLKLRDVATGKITKCELQGNEPITGNVLIVDDIADGGASFVHLAKLLKERGAEKVGLYVTHGIFSKGLEPLKEYIDYVFVCNIVGKYVNKSDFLEFNER